MKSLLSYVPHGINENLFFPIDESHPQYQELVKFKNEILGNKEYDFVLFFNSRNIRRKSIPDAMMAFKIFLDSLLEEQKDKCVFLLHTQPIDDNGTNLLAVGEMMFGEEFEKRIIFSNKPLASNGMNFLYNIADATILISSNEGWGLSTTESLMAGTMIIGNVTGGIQDQMRFQDYEGNWIEVDEMFPTNHTGKYKTCGEWAIPVFPSNISMQGSVPTPYITDARADFGDTAAAINEVYILDRQERKRRGLSGRTWVTSKESGMSSKYMAQNFMMSMDHLFNTWKPRESYQLIKIVPRKKRFVNNPISY